MSAREYHIAVKWSPEDEDYIATWEAPDGEFGVSGFGATPWDALRELAESWCLTATVVLEDDWFGMSDTEKPKEADDAYPFR